jgi:hypothetical protein
MFVNGICGSLQQPDGKRPVVARTTIIARTFDALAFVAFEWVRLITRSLAFVATWMRVRVIAGTLFADGRDQHVVNLLVESADDGHRRRSFRSSKIAAIIERTPRLKV